MEEAAKTQLHNLANQSQVTLSSIEERLTRSRRRLDEFHVVVKVCPLMIIKLSSWENSAELREPRSYCAISVLRR